ncbi:hypothetical protein Acr_20g0011570 [Actinidia rufa]|uniref:Uncharacterized protein n=1 Tax=Actinidia rufa TaxID=165716 RepID=A0A7J0GEZ2_9ERIC|nr:hypothetical protein Acr_20g0011570 [Actinidia rufa]
MAGQAGYGARGMGWGGAICGGSRGGRSGGFARRARGCDGSVRKVEEVVVLGRSGVQVQAAALAAGAVAAHKGSSHGRDNIRSQQQHQVAQDSRSQNSEEKKEEKKAAERLQQPVAAQAATGSHPAKKKKEAGTAQAATAHTTATTTPTNPSPQIESP